MVVYHVSYHSDEYIVRGYLAIPSADLDERQLLLEFNAAGIREARKLSALTDWGNVTTAATDSQPAPWPGFVYCRGGIGRVGMVRLDWLTLFASLGHVVFAPSYRGNEGGEGRDEFGGQDRQDVHQAVRILASLPFVRRESISVMGFSRGAVNATLSAVEVPSVRKLILWGGVSDLSATYDERPDLRRMLRRVIGGHPDQKPKAYRDRSPQFLAPEIPCPTLIVHGTADQQVDITHGLIMFDTMKQLGKTVDCHIYDGYGHHLPSPVHEAVVERMLDWTRE